MDEAKNNLPRFTTVENRMVTVVVPAKVGGSGRYEESIDRMIEFFESRKESCKTLPCKSMSPQASKECDVCLEVLKRAKTYGATYCYYRVNTQEFNFKFVFYSEKATLKFIVGWSEFVKKLVIY